MSSCPCVPQAGLWFLLSLFLDKVQLTKTVVCFVVVVYRESYKVVVSKPQSGHRKNQNKFISNDSATVVLVVSHQ